MAIKTFVAWVRTVHIRTISFSSTWACNTGIIIARFWTTISYRRTSKRQIIRNRT